VAGQEKTKQHIR